MEVHSINEDQLAITCKGWTRLKFVPLFCVGFVVSVQEPWVLPWYEIVQLLNGITPQDYEVIETFQIPEKNANPKLSENTLSDKKKKKKNRFENYLHSITQAQVLLLGNLNIAIGLSSSSLLVAVETFDHSEISEETRNFFFLIIQSCSTQNSRRGLNVVFAMRKQLFSSLFKSVEMNSEAFSYYDPDDQSKFKLTKGPPLKLPSFDLLLIPDNVAISVRIEHRSDKDILIISILGDNCCTLNTISVDIPVEIRNGKPKITRFSDSLIYYSLEIVPKKEISKLLITCSNSYQQFSSRSIDVDDILLRRTIKYAVFELFETKELHSMKSQSEQREILKQTGTFFKILQEYDSLTSYYPCQVDSIINYVMNSDHQPQNIALTQEIALENTETFRRQILTSLNCLNLFFSMEPKDTRKFAKILALIIPNLLTIPLYYFHEFLTRFMPTEHKYISSLHDFLKPNHLETLPLENVLLKESVLPDINNSYEYGKFIVNYFIPHYFATNSIFLPDRMKLDSYSMKLKNTVQLQELFLHKVEITFIGLTKNGKSSLAGALINNRGKVRPDAEKPTSHTTMIKKSTYRYVQEDVTKLVEVVYWDSPGIDEYHRDSEREGMAARLKGQIFLVACKCNGTDMRPTAKVKHLLQSLYAIYPKKYIFLCLTKIDMNHQIGQIDPQASLKTIRNNFSKILLEERFDFLPTNTEKLIPEENIIFTSILDEIKNLKDYKEGSVEYRKSLEDKHNLLRNNGVYNAEDLREWLRDKLDKLSILTKNYIEISNEAENFAQITKKGDDSLELLMIKNIQWDSDVKIYLDLFDTIGKSEKKIITPLDKIFNDIFSTGKKADSFTVIKEFPNGVSKPSLVKFFPCNLTWVAKKGDLRNDKFFMEMASIFNKIWIKDTACQFNWNSANNYFLPIQVKCYEVFPVGTTAGFLEFIPYGEPVLNLWNNSNLFTGEVSAFNPWKFSSKLFVTAVGYFVSVYLLGVFDLHQNNVLLAQPDNELVGIDFGFIAERPVLDTSDFPVPYGFKSMLINEKQWDNFKYFCYYAIAALQKNSHELCRLYSYCSETSRIQNAVSDFAIRLDIEQSKLDVIIENGSLDSLPKNFVQLVKEHMEESESCDKL